MSRLGPAKTFTLVVLNVSVWGGLLVLSPATRVSALVDGDKKQYQNCACVRVDPATRECLEWVRSGCPYGSVDTCGAPCPSGGGGGGGGGDLPPEIPKIQ